MSKLERFAPPGMKLSGWKSFFITVLVGCSLFSLFIFVNGLLFALEELYIPNTTMPIDDVLMWDFQYILGIAMDGFPIFAVSMVAFVVENYMYYFKDSKSIYTMARIRSPFELHLRSWALPLFSAGVMLLCREILVTVYFIIYYLATPEFVPLPDWSLLIWGLQL